MHYSNIKPIDIADGIGVRVALFVSGCTNHCEHCFNPETWDFNYGKEFTKEVEDSIFNMVNKSYIDGITVLGGEPMEPKNQKHILDFLIRFHEKFGNSKSVWMYTGFTIEQLNTEGAYCNTPITKDLLKEIDILVDGRFVEKLKNPALKFRGSSNQRIIDMKKTFSEKKIILAPFEDREYIKFE